MDASRPPHVATQFMATLSGSSCAGYALLGLPKTVYKAEKSQHSCKNESSSAAVMKAWSLFLLVAVAGSCAGQSLKQQLDNIGVHEPGTIDLLRRIFSKDNEANAVSCLVSGTPAIASRPCDVRTQAFRELLRTLDASNYICNECELDTQNQIDGFVNLFRRTFERNNCNTIKQALVLNNLRC
ncbi:uncharacterized protein LOC122264948 [Penaeus japonicus]|uniref:uncharacterized protein LOC122264948 n=1 Tax=Penaeus japonicus TaxID=27405 RepID=UPI001C70C72A|nr:uncharacterized protein LOC122264948 [Penaeus japonicus]